PQSEPQPPAPARSKPRRHTAKAPQPEALVVAPVAPQPKRSGRTKKLAPKLKEFIEDSDDEIPQPEKPKKKLTLTVTLPPKPKPIAGGSRVKTIDFTPEDPKVKIPASSTVLEVPMSYPDVPKFEDRVAHAAPNLPQTQDELDAMIQRAVDKTMEKIVEEELKPLRNEVTDLKTRSRKLERLLEDLSTEVDSGRRGLSEMRAVAVTSDDIARLEKAHDSAMRDLKKQVGLYVSLPKT
ncbi:hypothetical protein JAAARDRAFT_201382, partial [Jaapia argillacea MUCL 33604]